MPADLLRLVPIKVGDVERDLVLIGLKISDLDFRPIANEGMRLAAAFAPKRSGALRASIKGNKAKSRATIKAGGARVPYAGAINYGWPARNIKGWHFMQRADRVLRKTVPVELTAQIRRLIASKRMS